MLSAVEKKSDQVYRWLLAYIDENKFSGNQRLPSENALCRNTDFFIPDIESLIVLQINGRIETVCRDSYAFGQELPCPVDRFCLEVIAEGEVAQHLKECAVAGCLTDILDIAGTDTFLTCGDSASRRDLLSCEVRL